MDEGESFHSDGVSRLRDPRDNSLFALKVIFSDPFSCSSESSFYSLYGAITGDHGGVEVLLKLPWMDV